MKKLIKYSISTTLLAVLSLNISIAIANGGTNKAGTPVFLEANLMVSNAMNAPFASADGPGELIELNIITGERGFTLANPYNETNASNSDVCPFEIECPGPWKPTGTFSGGMNGHAFITSAGQQSLTEFYRDGTPIRTLTYRSLMGNPTGPEGRGTVPRPLGTQIMPNGNLVQTMCDANFFNAQNSDVAPEGGLEADQYFPPVNSTPKRAANSRILVIDHETMQVIDEYWQPRKGKLAHDLWGCFSGIIFDSKFMYVSTFHGGAILKIDWRSGTDRNSLGVGSNHRSRHQRPFRLSRNQNRAKVDGIIDFVGGPANNPHRRDTLRAISFDGSGNVYAANRRRSHECLRGEIGPSSCDPSVFRQRISIDIIDQDNGVNDEDATLALDPGVNIIAGIRIGRMSARGCDFVLAEGGSKDSCQVETLYISASAMNPGCASVGPVTTNPCFTPGGYVAEYRIDEAHLDGGSAWGGDECNGDPNDPAGNTGCAQPIATFGGNLNGDVNIDPRMMMSTQRAYIQ